jgi:hypothetical protein
MARSSKVAEAKITEHSAARLNIDIQIERWPIERLIPRANNPRTHSREQVARIAASIREFGFTNRILVGADDDIIAGHARLLAAEKLGMKEVPVIVLRHLSPAQRRALVIADTNLQSQVPLGTRICFASNWRSCTKRITLSISLGSMTSNCSGCSRRRMLRPD